MRILEVNIDRFGQFYKWSSALPDESLLIVFGQNEAGKSTLVAFIKCMLFGFPRKSELEPYLGSADTKGDLGGSVTLLLPEKGKVKVVRHRGRKNGQATIYLDNGEVMDEAILSEWLKGVDRDLYESIFCFDLEGLQGINQLKPDELNNFLFSTGMMGNAEIYEMEKELEKASGELFKSGGRNPIINKTLSELQTLRSKITSWEAQMDHYKEIKRALAQHLEELEKAEAKRQDIEQEKRDFLKYQACESLLIDFQQVKEEIEALPETFQFPENGKERFDHWHSQSISLQAERTDIERKIEEIQATIDTNKEDPILEYEGEIKTLVRESTERGMWEKELAKLGEQARNERSTIRDGLDQLNLPDEAIDRIKAVPAGLSIKQTLKEWMNKWQDTTQRCNAFELTIDEEESKLQLLKEKQQELTKEMMSDELFKELKLKISEFSPERLDYEKEQINKELANAKRQQEIVHLLGRLKWTIPSGTVVLFIVLAGFLVGTTSFLIAVLAFGGALTTGLWWTLNKLQNRFKPESKETDLKRRMHELNEVAPVDINQSIHLYEQEKSKREQLSMLSIQVNDVQGSYQKNIQKLDQVTMTLVEIERGIDEWREGIGLPPCEPAILPDLYQLVEKVREHAFRLENIESQIKEYNNLLERTEEKIKTQGIKLNMPGMELYEFEKRVEQAKQAKEKRDRLVETLEHLDESRGSLSNKIARYEEECGALLEQAGVETEEAFRRLGSTVEVKAAKLNQKQSLYRQLCHLVPHEEERDKCFDWLKTGRWDGHEEGNYNSQLTELDERIESIRQERSDLKSKIDHLEKDESYADLLHEYEEKRSILNDHAKQWGVLRIAASFLKQAKENYRETRLPKVLSLASQYLYQVTNLQYKQLYYTEADGFTLERTDGALFAAGELSRGTGEQLYLAIRLALIDVYETPERLPIIIDDGFVNFDARRRRQVIEVMRGLSNERQIILFTCHHYKTQGIDQLILTREGGGGDVRPVISDSAR